jgi:hypothetical protein
MVMSVALLSYLFVAVAVPAATAAGSKPSTINVDNLVLPEGISAVMIGDYSKAPDLEADGAKPYSCLAIYLVSSLNSATVVHVSGLTLAASDGGKNILHGGSLSGYLTVGRKTEGSEFLPSSQALGRLSPNGTFSNPLALRNPGHPAVPDVLNCQTASIGRMHGLTISSPIDYSTNKTLYLSGQVDPATASTYDITQLKVPKDFVAKTTFKTGDGYRSSCIKRNGQSTTIGISLKFSGVYVPSGKYIARNVTVDGVSYPTPGIPNFRSTCIPVAIVPNNEMGDITGDHSLVITGDIIPWSLKITDSIDKNFTQSKMVKFQLGAVDSDKVLVSYDPTPNVKKSFVWLTGKSRGSLANCSDTEFDYTGLSATYVAKGSTLLSERLVTKIKAHKYAVEKVSSGGDDTYAVLSFPGNIFERDGTLKLTGNLQAKDICKS